MYLLAQHRLYLCNRSRFVAVQST